MEHLDIDVAVGKSRESVLVRARQGCCEHVHGTRKSVGLSWCLHGTCALVEPGGDSVLAGVGGRGVSVTVVSS